MTPINVAKDGRGREKSLRDKNIAEGRNIYLLLYPVLRHVSRDTEKG